MDAASTSDAIQRARETLRRVFGHQGFREGQEAVVSSAMAGRNLLVVMPTGSGKSLLYQLPALLAHGLTLVISPLIALMKDQVDELVRRGAPATFINSSLSIDEQRRRMADAVAGRVRLLYVAPERFQSAAFLDMLKKVRVARMAVDEAHCISEWGHDFRPDYRRIKQFRQIVGAPCVTALTATATPRVQQDIIESLGLKPAEVEVHVHGFDRPNLVLSVIQEHDADRKLDDLLDIVRRETGPGIVYVGTRRKTDELAEALREIEPTTLAYHAGLDPEDRAAAQERFLSGKARIAVATIAFGMGIDKADVRFVVHFNYPGSVEQYYQEIGRAGRDGQPSRCVLLFSPEDRFLREFFIDLNHPSREIVQNVYETLWDIPDNPVTLTCAGLAKMCGDVKEGQVASALRMMDHAGLTRALSSEATAVVRLDRPGAEILAAIRGPNQRLVFEALSVAADLESPGVYRFSLDEVAKAAAMTEEQVRRALASLAQDGRIVYDAPFRGRGVEKLVADPPPFHKAPFDWKRQDFLRRLEEDKLERMEAYIHDNDCRRAFVLRYFGETTSLRCGECDNCVRASGATRSAKGRDVLDLQPHIARAVLTAIAHVPFPLGAGLISGILTGSRAENLLRWRQDRNPAFGVARGEKKAIRNVIADLVNQGYLRHDGEPGRPTLVLTDRGQEALDSPLPPKAAPKAPRTGTSRADPPAVTETRCGSPPTAGSQRVPGTEKKTEAAQATAVERAALACVAAIRPAVGAGRVADVLAGSRAAWVAESKADQLPMYASVRLTQKRIREIVHDMVRRNLLAQQGSGRYPTLALTEAGKAALAQAPAEKGSATSDVSNRGPRGHAAAHSAGVRAPLSPIETDRQTPPPASPTVPGTDVAAPHPPADKPAEPAPMAALALLEHLLDELLESGRDTVNERLDALRVFHPREITRRLAARFEAAAQESTRARIVWTAGELCETHGLSFLLAAAADPAENIRRLTASALGKLAQSGHIPPPAVASARRALEALSQDSSPQARQYALKALSFFPAHEPACNDDRDRDTDPSL